MQTPSNAYRSPSPKHKTHAHSVTQIAPQPPFQFHLSPSSIPFSLQSNGIEPPQTLAPVARPRLARSWPAEGVAHGRPCSPATSKNHGGARLRSVGRLCTPARQPGRQVPPYTRSSAWDPSRPSPPRCSTRTRPRQPPVRPLVPSIQSIVLEEESILPACRKTK
jgi:hypothetical protein